MRLLSVPTLMVGLIALLAGCGSGGSPPPKTAAASGANTRPEKATARRVEAAKPEPTPPPEKPFVFVPDGLRDPFAPFIKLNEKKAQPKVFVPKTPLQRYAAEELKLVGIVWAESGKAKALIEDPEGKGYVATVGTLVGDRGGGIVKIHPERLLIRERFVDQLGEETVRMVKMTLHKPEGEVSQ